MDIRETVRRRRVPLTIAGVLLAWVAFFSLATIATSNPLFCGLCHEMRPVVRAWSNSPHAEVSCYACHGGPGIRSFVRSKTALGVFFYRHVLGLYTEPINKRGTLGAAISGKICLGCHTPRRVVTPTKGIRIDHVVHTKQGMACTSCHNRVSHPDVRGHRDYLKMDACFRCHGLEPGSKATGRCLACHTSTFDLKPDSHRTKAWKLKRHGASARKNRKACAMCHFKTFCGNCHQLPMPHPPDWARGRNTHSRVGIKSPLLCVNCHRQRDFCSTCHHKGYVASKGPWVRQHFKIVRANGVYECIRCHGLTFCATCHVRGLSQPGQI